MSCTASFRLYEELNDYVPSERRKVTFSVIFRAPVTIRDAICSLGVPPQEVDLVLVNGESVPFDHLITEGDMVSIYPIFESLDISGITRLREKPLIALAPSFKTQIPKGGSNGKEKD